MQSLTAQGGGSHTGQESATLDAPRIPAVMNVFGTSWTYKAFSSLHLCAVLSVFTLGVFVPDAAPKQILVLALALAGAAVATFVIRLARCGVFVNDGVVTLRTILKTTNIPLARLRISGREVCFVAQAGPVPLFRDVDGPNAKATVLIALPEECQANIVRQLLWLRDEAVHK